MRLDIKLSLLSLISSLMMVIILLAVVVMNTHQNGLQTMADAEKNLLKNKTDLVFELASTSKQVAEGAASEEEAIKLLSTVRYENGSGYLFAYARKDSSYIFAFHGTKAELNGKVTDVTQPDVKGFAFRQALIQAADQRSEGGPVEYYYENPSSKVVSKKIAYAIKVPKYNWYLVTGVYMDDIEKEIARMSEEQAVHTRSMIFNVVVASILLLVVAVAVMVLVVRRVSAKLLYLAEEVYDLAKNTSEVSQKISDASLSFSSSTQEQSSSLEESSASLEELDKMIQENLQSSNNTSQSVDEVRTITEDGNKAMEETMGAIKEIMEANREIQELAQVIQAIGDKTSVIDDIVFQTKLLSFNASVEAERAGEHGRGFAVVAQEVGSLAEMSGKAAQEISGIVRNSVLKSEQIVKSNLAKVQKGNDLVNETAKKLKQIEEKTHVVASQMTNIVTASKEQSLGISQINEAVSHIDAAVQENAGNAEQMARVGEDLVRYAGHLSDISSELRFAITGAREG